MDITNEGILSIDDAKEAERFIGVTRIIERGNLADAFDTSKHILSGTFRCNGQTTSIQNLRLHWSTSDRARSLEVHSSSQHPTETQHLVAEALGLKFHQVICIVK